MSQIVQAGQVLKISALSQMCRILCAVSRIENGTLGRLCPCGIHAVCADPQHLNLPHVAVQDVPFRLIEHEADVGFHGGVFPLDDIIFAVLDRLGWDLDLPLTHDPFRQVAAAVRNILVRPARTGTQQQCRRKHPDEKFCPLHGNTSYSIVHYQNIILISSMSIVFSSFSPRPLSECSICLKKIKDFTLL